MTRKDANIELLNKLEYCIERYPDMRFSQILQNFGFIKPIRPAKDSSQVDWQNEFYVEGGQLLDRVIRRIEDVEYENNKVKDEES